MTAATGSLGKAIEEALASLRHELGDNLHSCCLYGSAVRGNLMEGVSDLNLLIVLDRSEPAAHGAIARAIGGEAGIDPFVLGRQGFERSVRAFAAKFSSIKRNYRVLYGADPLAEVVIEPELEKFLCEQALRNLRLRLAYAYITRARHKSYGRFLVRSVTPLFLRLSEMVRLDGAALPVRFDERIALLEETLTVDGHVLRDLLALKQNPEIFSPEGADEWHARVFLLVDAALHWIERHWPDNGLKAG